MLAHKKEVHCTIVTSEVRRASALGFRCGWVWLGLFGVGWAGHALGGVTGAPIEWGEAGGGAAAAVSVHPGCTDTHTCPLIRTLNPKTLNPKL